MESKEYKQTHTYRQTNTKTEHTDRKRAKERDKYIHSDRQTNRNTQNLTYKTDGKYEH